MRGECRQPVKARVASQLRRESTKANNTMPKKEKRGGNKARSEGTFKGDIGNMQYWRGLAQSILPDVDDEYEVGEIAVILHQVCVALGKEQPTISKICNKNEDSSISFSLACAIDRRTTPPEVQVKLSFSEKHALTLKSTVPDPKQTELPGLDESEVVEPKAGAGGDGAGETPPE